MVKPETFNPYIRSERHAKKILQLLYDFSGNGKLHFIFTKIKNDDDDDVIYSWAPCQTSMMPYLWRI